LRKRDEKAERKLEEKTNKVTSAGADKNYEEESKRSVIELLQKNEKPIRTRGQAL